MATNVWTPRVAARKQIFTVTFTGTFVATDTVTATVGGSQGKALIVTVGTAGTSLADVASAFKNAWNATSRLDGLGAPDATSNFGGGEFGEFYELDASINPVAPTIVILTAREAGKSFPSVAVTDSSAAGTAVLATSQAATGPNHWDAVNNWNIGVVPVDDDVVVFKNSSVSVKYGLPNGSLNITIIQYQSFTGNIGLAETNVDNQGDRVYREYRQRYVRLDDFGATAGSTKTHIFGLGPGIGSSLINISHNNGTVAPNDLTVSAVIYNTGTPQTNTPETSGKKSLNLLIANGGTHGGAVTALKGSINLGRQDLSFSPFFPTLNIGYTQSQASDVDVFLENHGTSVTQILTVNQSGGTLFITEPNTGIVLSDIRILNISGGHCICQDIRTSSGVTATVVNGSLTWNTTKTITSLTVGTRGIFDAEKDGRAFTITNCDLHEGASLLDEYSRGIYTNGIDLNRCGVDDVTLHIGNNRRLTLGTAV